MLYRLIHIIVSFPAIVDLYNIDTYALNVLHIIIHGLTFKINRVDLFFFNLYYIILIMFLYLSSAHTLTTPRNFL